MYIYIYYILFHSFIIFVPFMFANIFINFILFYISFYYFIYPIFSLKKHHFLDRFHIFPRGVKSTSFDIVASKFEKLNFSELFLFCLTPTMPMSCSHWHVLNLPHHPCMFHVATYRSSNLLHLHSFFLFKFPPVPTFT